MVNIEKINLSELDGDNIFQSNFWAEFKKGSSWKSYPFSVSIKDKNFKILVLVKKIVLNFHMAYIPFGLDTNFSYEEIEELSKKIRIEIPDYLFTIRYDFKWGSENRIEGKRLVYADESVQPEGTVIINLPDEYKLTNRAKRNLKAQSIINVEKYNGNIDDFLAWYNTYTATALRDRFHTRPLSYVKRILEINADKVKPILYLAKYEGEIVGGILTLRSQKDVLYLYGSSQKVKRGVSCGYVLQEAAIKDAIADGLKNYDFYGINAKENRGSHLDSLYTFKTSFGGKPVYRVPTCDYKYNSFIYFLYKSAENFRYFLHRN